MRDSLGDRMKEYERISDLSLIKKMPVIIRLDGKAFHTFTRGFDKPFDVTFNRIMQNTTLDLCKNIQCCQLGYTQSDEISLLLTDYDDVDTSCWYDNRVQKMVSVSSSLATMYFNKNLELEMDNIIRFIESMSDEENAVFYTVADLDAAKQNLNLLRNKKFLGCFDSRAFNLSMNEVSNYFIWRQNDATRNSINSLALSLFKPKDISGINSNDLQNKMLVEKDVNWNKCHTVFKRGCCVIRDENGSWFVDTEMPIIKDNREYIEKLVFKGMYRRD